jgi:hypothetical protein
MTQHVQRTYRSHRRSAWAAVVGLVALAVIFVPAGHTAKPPSADIKNYTACLQYGTSPSCTSSGQSTVLPGGQSVQLTLTLTNDRRSNQTLGSANLTAPSELPIDRSQPITVSQGHEAGLTDATLELRNLNLAKGTSVTVAFSVTTPCSGTGLQWHVQAKQSNNFLGTGNDFNLQSSTGLTTNVNGCYELRFVSQPAKTVVGQTITDADYSVGGPIVVGLYGAGQPVQECPSGTNNVTMSKNQAAGTLGGTLTQTLTGTPCAASFNNLSISATGTFTLKATGLGASVDSESFQIVNGTSCIQDGVPLDPCPFGPLTTGNTSSSGEATGGTFVFVALEQIDLGYIPAGCFPDGFKSVGADALFIAEQRTELSGELFVTYGIRKNLITKAYGNNSGQQFIPICAGAKRLELVNGVNGTTTRPVDCTATYDGKDQVGWWGKKLYESESESDPNRGKFTGDLAQAVCDETSGFFFGILASFQDYTNSDACRIVDPATSPTVVEWTSDATHRYFKSRWPSSSAVELQKVDVSTPCPDPANRADFANVPWDGWKFG